MPPQFVKGLKMASLDPDKFGKCRIVLALLDAAVYTFKCVYRFVLAFWSYYRGQPDWRSHVVAKYVSKSR